MSPQLHIDIPGIGRRTHSSPARATCRSLVSGSAAHSPSWPCSFDWRIGAPGHVYNCGHPLCSVSVAALSPVRPPPAPCRSLVAGSAAQPPSWHCSFDWRVGAPGRVPRSGHPLCSVASPRGRLAVPSHTWRRSLNLHASIPQTTGRPAVASSASPLSACRHSLNLHDSIPVATCRPTVARSSGHCSFDLHVDIPVVARLSAAALSAAPSLSLVRSTRTLRFRYPRPLLGAADQLALFVRSTCVLRFR